MKKYAELDQNEEEEKPIDEINFLPTIKMEFS